MSVLMVVTLLTGIIIYFVFVKSKEVNEESTNFNEKYSDLINESVALEETLIKVNEEKDNSIAKIEAHAVNVNEENIAVWTTYDIVKENNKVEVSEESTKTVRRSYMIYGKEWNKIVDKLKDGSVELPTVPKTNRTPVWFVATTDGDKIYINKSLQNGPSCSLKMQRILDHSTFQKIYPLYLKRENGEQVSQEATSITVNSGYYYSLIKHLCS